MTRCAQLIATLLLCFDSALLAEELQAPEPRQPIDLTLSAINSADRAQGRPILAQRTSFAGWNNFYQGPRPLTLADETTFSFPSAFGWMGPTPLEFLPTLVAEDPRRVRTGASFPSETGIESPSLFSKFDHASGEVGFFYGKSFDKFDREVTAGYILGEIDNGNTQISVGASYLHSSGRSPR